MEPLPQLLPRSSWPIAAHSRQIDPFYARGFLLMTRNKWRAYISGVFARVPRVCCVRRPAFRRQSAASLRQVGSHGAALCCLSGSRSRGSGRLARRRRRRRRLRECGNDSRRRRDVCATCGGDFGILSLEKRKRGPRFIFILFYCLFMLFFNQYTPFSDQRRNV